jgi:hypothetical protein
MDWKRKKSVNRKALWKVVINVKKKHINKQRGFFALLTPGKA